MFYFLKKASWPKLCNIFSFLLKIASVEPVQANKLTWSSLTYKKKKEFDKKEKNKVRETLEIYSVL